MHSPLGTKDLSIYIHWPFCEAKCPYCDFNSYVARTIDHSAWEAAFCTALEQQALFSADRLIHTIYFGGGTPSLMKPQAVDKVLNTIGKYWRFKNDVEITLEANPSSVEQSRFSDFRKAGVNRVSLGVQALNDQDLKRLGRVHSVDDALNALDIAQSVFDRASFDLIYGRQNQSLEDWTRELERALSFGFSHMSLYSLTIEDGTAFGDRLERNLLSGLPDEDLQVDMFDATRQLCERYELFPYEVSNFATKDEWSKHNMVYWAGGDYLGIGPGAHGRFTDSNGTRWASETELNPMKWLKSDLSKAGTTWSSLSKSEHAVELISMGLRRQSGIDLQEIYTRTDNTVSSHGLAQLQESGAVIVDDNRVFVDPKWVNLLNQIVLKLLPE